MIFEAIETKIFKNAELIFVVVFFFILISPIIVYLVNGWRTRRDDIVGFFSPDVIRAYFSTFFPSYLAAPNLSDAFRDHYKRRFGRQHFVLPAIGFGAISLFYLFLIAETVHSWLKPASDSEFIIPPIAVSAIAGAYMWVLFDFITRARCQDLDPADLFWASFRFSISVPLGLSLSAIFTNNVGMPLAFILGVFPTQTLMTMVRRIGTSKLDLPTYADEAGRELEQLQGINRVTAERFGDEGVKAILQLAYTDPVDLTLRTSFDYMYVVDCCSQALAWIYLEGTLGRIRRYGLRGAQEINTYILEIDGQYGSDTQTKARAVLNLVAAEVGVHSDGLEHTLREIAEDPYAKFLCNVWMYVAPEDTET